MEKKFKSGSIREMISVSLPIVISFSCHTLMTFTDRMFLSRIGSKYMSAAMAGGITCFMMMTLLLGLTGYVTALSAQYFGAGNKSKCTLAVTQALIIAILAYPIIVLFKPIIFNFFHFMKIEPAQLVLQKEYFSILIYGTIFTLITTCFSSFFSGIGRTKIVMLSAITTMCANVFLNYILIFGKFGFPKLYIKGAAFGTVIGSIFGLIVLLFAYFKKTNQKEFLVKESFKFDKTVMKTLLKYGSPAGIEMLLNIFAFNLIILIFHSHGLQTAISSTIVFNWDMVSFVPLIGIEIGVTSLVGRYMGAGKPDIAERSTMSGLKMGWVYSIFVFILFIGFPKHLVLVFRPFEHSELFTQIVPITIFMLRATALYVLVEAIIVVFSGALRGAGDTFWAMFISITIHWVLVFVLIITLKILNFSPQISWLILVFLFLFSSSAFYIRYKTGKWKHIKMIKEEKLPLIPTDEFHELKDL